MDNDIPMQDSSHRSAIANDLIPPTSLAVPMVQCISQSARVENIPMFVVDGITTMPILQDRFQRSSVPNLSFPLMSNQHHGYITTQIESEFPCRPIPSSLYSSRAPIVDHLSAIEQIMGLPHHDIEDLKSEKQL